MMWPTITVPIIHTYPLKIQLTILSVLLLISYLHRKSRFLIAFLITAYFLFKIFVPLVQWTWIFFKAVAWFGFYIHYFQSGFGFIVGTAALVWNGGCAWLAGWLERVSREREAERERKREEERQRERERDLEAEREREREERRRTGGDGASGAFGGKKGKKNRR